MNFHDCISTAALSIVEQDVPDNLLPLLIANQAALLSGGFVEHVDVEHYH